MSWRRIMSESRICIALDFQTKDEVKAFLDKFEDEKLYVKIGMELFYGEGIEMIKMIKEKGHKIENLFYVQEQKILC